MSKLDLHKRLKIARKTLQLNQIDIANDLSIHQKSISEIENGKIINIPNSYIYYFYKKGVSLEWIYEEKGEMLNEDKKHEETFQEVTKQLNFNLDSKPDIVSNNQPSIPDDEVKSLYERLVSSKDLTIEGMQAYINSLENNLNYLKTLLAEKK